MNEQGQHRDPICGMPGVIERHGQWFCSERCAAQFEGQASAAGHQAGGRGHPARRGWARDPWLWVPVTAAAVSVTGSLWPGLAGVSALYLAYAKTVALPSLFGLAIGGAIEHFIPRQYVVKLLTGQRKRVIARATLLGFLASTCSHGCLALAVELYRKGASVPAVVSFLLASPWASMSLTLILLSLFGWSRGLILIAGALTIAAITGLLFQQLARRGAIEPNPHTLPVDEGFSIRRDLLLRWRRYPWSMDQLLRDARGVLSGMLPLGRMVLGWVQLGLVLSALLGGLVPHEAFKEWLGPSPGGLALTLLAAAAIEVCSEGTAPLAFELYRHSGAFGNAFAFLMGGVVTDYTELGVLWSVIGKRTVLWMLAVTLPLVILAGWLLNVISGM